MTESVRAIVLIIVVLIVLLTVAAMLVWLERRLLALWQDRYGPNRVGPFGLLQTLADTIKLLTKEDWIPPFADKPVFVIAPAVIMVTVLMAFAVVPFAPTVQSSTSTSACCSSWRCRRSASTASSWRAGRRTTSTRSSAACAPPHRCSATRSSWGCR